MKNNQILEMAEFMADVAHVECALKVCEDCKWCGKERSKNADCTDYLIAEHLHKRGYRKASDVAREIFEEIDHMCIDTFGNFNHRRFAELKKKYTEEITEGGE